MRYRESRPRVYKVETHLPLEAYKRTQTITRHTILTELPRNKLEVQLPEDGRGTVPRRKTRCT